MKNRQLSSIELADEVVKDTAVEHFRLGPGERRTGQVNLAKAFGVDEPGEYSIYVVTAGRKSFVRSNNVRIHVTD